MPISTRTARPPKADVFPRFGYDVSGWDAAYTSVWKIWLSTAMDTPRLAFGKACTRVLIPFNWPSRSHETGRRT